MYGECSAEWMEGVGAFEGQMRRYLGNENVCK